MGLAIFGVNGRWIVSWRSSRVGQELTSGKVSLTFFCLLLRRIVSNSAYRKIGVPVSCLSQFGTSQRGELRRDWSWRRLEVFLYIHRSSRTDRRSPRSGTGVARALAILPYCAYNASVIHEADLTPVAGRASAGRVSLRRCQSENIRRRAAWIFGKSDGRTVIGHESFAAEAVDSFASDHPGGMDGLKHCDWRRLPRCR